MASDQEQSWKQERPTWCPHKDCIFKRRVMDAICGGELATPEPHDGGLNTHRVCTQTDQVIDLQVNETDLEWFRWVYDALDGRQSSWLSRRQTNAQ